MKELSMREIQLGEFHVLQKLKELCEMLDLRYFLFFGTMLGAVRHQGFIPWDDDVDVAMPRPDYEKLLDYCEQNKDALKPFQLMNHRNNSDYIYPISRLCDTRYYVDYQDTVEYGLGLFVDIYPLDGCGNTKEEVDRIHKKNQILKYFVFLGGTTKYQPSPSGGFFRSFAKFLVYSYAKLVGVSRFIYKIDKNSTKYTLKDSKYANISVWSGKTYYLERDWFSDVKYVDFEGEQFPIPVGSDKMMEQWYGDYMQLPPEEDRIAHHNYKAYLKDA